MWRSAMPHLPILRCSTSRPTRIPTLTAGRRPCILPTASALPSTTQPIWSSPIAARCRTPHSTRTCAPPAALSAFQCSGLRHEPATNEGIIQFIFVIPAKAGTQGFQSLAPGSPLSRGRRICLSAGFADGLQCRSDETTTVRISNDLAICEAPLDVAGELLRAEGFTDVGYVDTAADDLSAAIADRKVDFALDFPVLFAPGIDAGKPITVLAGVHVGCFELFAGNDIRTIANLKGKTVGFEIAPAALLRLMVAQVGLDPDEDIRWVTDPSVKPLELFVEGKIDAFLGFPPEPQELRARKIGHVIFS